MKETRIHAIESFIYKNKEVSMKELQTQFNVSMNTIRADVAELIEAGQIMKVYGGVRLVHSIDPFENRRIKDMDQKILVSQKAAAMVNSEDTIYLDYGTTTMSVPNYIDDSKHVTIITPNMYIVQSCLNRTNIDLMILPGEFDKQVFGVLSENTIKDLENYHIGKAFMSCSGIMKNGSVGSGRFIQNQIKEAVMKISQEKYLMVDSKKFEMVPPLSYCNIGVFENVISDSFVRQESAEMCASHGTKLI